MPASHDIVLAKAATVDRCLQRIKSVTQGDPASLDAQDAQDIFVLNLQRAVQATIDLANHLVAESGLELPTTLRSAFDRLEAGAGLPGQLASKMRSMVGFRNIAVHDYQAIDKGVLKAILEHHLSDLNDFLRYAFKRAELDVVGRPPGPYSEA